MKIKGFLLAITVVLFSLILDLAVVFETIEFTSWTHLGARAIEQILLIVLLIFASIGTDEEYEPKMAITSMFLYSFISGTAFTGLKISGWQAFTDVGFILVCVLFLGKVVMATIAYIINNVMSE